MLLERFYVAVLSGVVRITRRGRRSHLSSPEPEPQTPPKSGRNGTSTMSLYETPCSSFGFLRLRDIPGQAHPQPHWKARKGNSGYNWISWTRRTRDQTTQPERREQEWQTRDMEANASPRTKPSGGRIPYAGIWPIPMPKTQLIQLSIRLASDTLSKLGALVEGTDISALSLPLGPNYRQPSLLLRDESC